MSSAIQRRRGSTAQHSTFTGLVGELTVDTTKKTVVVHDGATVGGFPLPRFYDIQPSDPTLTALAGVGTSADTMIYATGVDTFATTPLTGVARSLLDDATIPAMRSTLGLTPGSDPGNVMLVPTGGSPNHRNMIINGNFKVNQRNYTSGGTLSTSLYGHDMWKMANSGDTYTFSTAGDGLVTVTIPASKVLRQVIEGVNLKTATYCLSWTGTAQGKIGTGAYGASGVTAAVTGGANLTIEFGPGTVSEVQLEVGTTRTTFETRNYQFELMSCQRYYETGRNLARSYLYNATANASDKIIAGGSFKVTKRATPTLVLVNNAGSGSLSLALTTVGEQFVEFSGSFTTLMDYSWSAEATL